MHALTIWDWMMLVSGIALLSAAAAAIWGSRVQRAAGRTAPVSWLPPLSEATRLSIGVVLGLWGYHLIAWSLPATWVPLRAPGHFWPWMLGAAVLWLGGSLVMDAGEAGDRVGPDTPNDTDRTPN
jgi:hypothetical protein